MAIILSFVALSVSICEANILKEQQGIIPAQQQASVWPYLQANLRFEIAEMVRAIFTVQNKDVGPARVSQVILDIQGTERSSFNAFLDAFRLVFPPGSDMGLSYSQIKELIFTPGEK